MAELDRTGVAAMLTADAEFNPRPGFPTADDGLLHQGPYTFSIEHRKGVRFHDVGSTVKIDELGRIITGETKRGLGEVVRPE
jgi:hypothetical protein